MTENTVAALITPEATGVWCQLVTPALPRKPKSSDKPKFGITLLFTHEVMKTPEFAAMQAAVVTCASEKFGKAKAETMIREGSLRSPFRKDIETKGYPSKYGCYISISSNAEYPPALVDRAGQKITDPREFYHGVRLRASIAARAYGGPGHNAPDGSPIAPGVSLDLRNVQKIGDADRITVGNGGTGDGSEFGALPAEAGADQPLADMLA